MSEIDEYKRIAETLSGGLDPILEEDRRIESHEPFLKKMPVIFLSDVYSKHLYDRLVQVRDHIEPYTKGLSRFYVVPTETGVTCYFVAFQGENGRGDFAMDDLSSAIAILQGLRMSTKGATMIDMRHDILDDVSAWSYVFDL